MSNIEMKWYIEGDKKYIICQDIKTRIEINETNKDLINVKSFFRELIFQSFINDWNKKVVLLDDSINEIIEVKEIINELIKLCNKEMQDNSNHASPDP